MNDDIKRLKELRENPYSNQYEIAALRKKIELCDLNKLTQEERRIVFNYD